MPTNFFSCFLNFFTFFSSSTHCFAERSLFCRALIVLPSLISLHKAHVAGLLLLHICPTSPSLISLHKSYTSELLLFHTHPTSPSFYRFTRTPRRRAFTVSHAPHVAEPLLLHICPTSPSFYCFTRTPRRRAFTVPYMPHVAGLFLFHTHPTSPGQASQPPRQSPKARC